MSVVECQVPVSSVLDRALVDAAYFRDSYRAPLTRADLGMVEIFFALFGHTPLYVKLLLIVRNAAARLAGLDAPSVSEILRPARHPRYAVGDRIGPWPVFAISDSEIVAGRDNKHLDFRLSVLKQHEGADASVTVSTICSVHNRAGRIYLFFIVPFHRFGVRGLMRRAIQSGRL